MAEEVKANGAIDTYRIPLVVAGPCSAENPEQVLTCAHELARLGCVDFYRAGVWKPRTRPGGFEGRGKQALPWLAQAQLETGIPVCVEVATAAHVRAARDYGIASYWIGARTASDPFAVEELSHAIPPGDGVIFVKNPISPDLELWIGAIERFRRAGHARVVAVHRGFYAADAAPLRNSPRWEVPLALRSRLGDLQIVCDPSHIAGRAELVPGIAQQALDYSFDGLFVEVHPSPQHALSDAAQQLTPAEFGAMMRRFHYSVRAGERELEPDLAHLRDEIDRLDSQILELLGVRMRTVQRIGAWKMEHGVQPYHPGRWRQLLAHHLRYGEMVGLDRGFVRNLCHLVHTEALRVQGNMRGDDTQGEV